VPVLGLRHLLAVQGLADERIAAIAAIAARQRGRVSRPQLLAAGVSDRMIRTRVDAGRLLARLRGVYAVGHAAAGELTREAEALLACAQPAVLSHSSAVALWQLLPSQTNPRAPVELTVSTRHPPRHPGVHAHRTSTLARQDTRIERGLPVTSPARTFIDIAGNRTGYELERALDDALQRNLVRLPQLKDTLARNPNRKGAGLLRAILADRETGSGLSRSDMELILKRLLRAADIPDPDLNANFGRYQPDMVWWQQRLIVEIDSWRWHGNRRSFETDRKRDATLTTQGWTILRFTARQIENEPYLVIARIAAALALASAAASERRDSLTRESLTR
jgi:very-short-patch-repair endonuclease/predicted transcriptional regulator of viral defense system